jgi:hypothetical protein
MATEKWIAGSGQGLTYGTAINSSDLASLANGSSVLSSLADITNGTSLDIFADISINFPSITVAAPAYFGIYLYPLNQDGSTYGDNQLSSGSQAAKTPSQNYFVGSILVPTGAGAVNGTLRGIILPPGSFRFVGFNQLGAALTSGTQTCKYRTYNRAVA